MQEFNKYLSEIKNESHCERVSRILEWVIKTFLNLKAEIKWNQPMFTDHGTFIIGFSISKNHLAVSPEVNTIIKFEEEIKDVGYSISNSNMLFKIKWEEQIDFSLLERIIAYNSKEKSDCKTFWRK